MPQIKQTKVNGTLYDIRDAIAPGQIIAPEYDNTSVYDIDNFCTHGLRLKKCIVAIPTPEEWNDEHWTNATVMSEIQNSQYSLPLASSLTRGGVKTGFPTSAQDKNYAVQLDNEQMYVNVPWTDTTYNDMTGATSLVNGAHGLVPAPQAGDEDKFLSGHGTWATVSTTDTKNTAGATDTSSKIYLVGATTQGANPQTYSHDTAYVGVDGCLYSNDEQVLTQHQDISGKANDSEVVHNTGAEAVAGTKTFQSPVVLCPPDTDDKYILFKHNTDTNGTSGTIRMNAGNATNQTKNQFSFREYSPQTTAGTASTGFYESYALPLPTKGLDANASYEILTTKNVVSVAQGGTGATTASGALANLGGADDSTVVHLAGSEDITGTKYFTTGQHIMSSGASIKYLYFTQNKASNGKVAEILANAGDPTNQTYNKLYFREYSPKTVADTANTGFYEEYTLPVPTKGLSANASYEILTTKNTVSIAQGGTGATTASGALTNLGGASDSGVVHNTGNENVGGVKKFTDNLHILRENATDIVLYFDKNTATNGTAGQMLMSTGNATNQTRNAFLFRQWSPKETDATDNTGYYEAYWLPYPAKGLTENKTYNILTTKHYGNVENKSSATIRGELTSSDINSALGFTPTQYSAGTGLTLSNGTFSVSQANVNTMINLLSNGTSELTANDYVITQYVGGGTTNTDYYRRPASKVVNATLVKSALGTNSTHGGNYLRKDGTWQDPISGCVTISGEQTITGKKTFTDQVYMSTNARYKSIAFGRGGDNSYPGSLYLDMGDNTKQTVNRFFFRQYSPKSTADTGNSGYYEDIRLPAPTVGRTSSKSYDILTSKTAVTVAQGGTGSTSASGARTNLGVPADTDVVHNTGTETIDGTKTFSASVSITTGQWKALFFKQTASSDANTTCGAIYCNMGDATKQSKNQMFFNCYSPKSTAATTNTGFYEQYQLPSPTAGLAENKTYGILTTKSAVNVAQGGTGSTTASGARTNLGVPADTAVVHLTGNESIAGVKTFSNTTESSSTTSGAVKISGGLGVAKNIYGAKVYNAVWNDYAECRQADTIEAGYCVAETESGVMTKSTERLQAGCKLTSDTYGTCMGETDTAKTPIAVAGRVLAYPFRDVKEYHLGDAVCSAPDGKIDVMTREEIREYPERIIGTVSEIPKYDVWQGGTKENPQPIPVNGRIWIYVR